MVVATFASFTGATSPVDSDILASLITSVAKHSNQRGRTSPPNPSVLNERWRSNNGTMSGSRNRRLRMSINGGDGCTDSSFDVNPDTFVIVADIGVDCDFIADNINDVDSGSNTDGTDCTGSGEADADVAPSSPAAGRYVGAIDVVRG